MNDNPAFGAGLQPFMGIPSFMRLPVSRELDGVDVAILGVPFDSGTSYRTGTRFGPRKIREASLMIWGHNSTLNVTPLKKLKVVDYGDVSVIPTSIEHTMTAITKMAREIIDTGTRLITLGGDHSIALPSCAPTPKNMGRFPWSTSTLISIPGKQNSSLYLTVTGRRSVMPCRKD